jgi:hypothetical protein
MARTTIREEDITSGAVPTTGIVGTSVFTASGTWKKATREAALGVTIKRVIVEVQGAGGAGVKTTTNPYRNGGGGGGYAKKLLDVSLISSATITVGSGGAGSSSSNTQGGDGGNSSWSDGTNTITGSGGTAGLVSNYNVGLGGTATGGDLNIDGKLGESQASSYGGGGSFLGGISPVQYNTSRAYGQDGVFGSGGAAPYATYPSGTRAGNGGDGIVIVTEIAG